MSASSETVLITGANQGIGFATAKSLARKGYNITIACRNETKAVEAVKAIQAENASVKIDHLLVDFSQLEDVQRLGQEICKHNRTFDIVILNAGVLLPSERKSKDELDMSFQVNYLAQYHLLSFIINNQKGSKNLKVITLTSVMHKLCGSLYKIHKKSEKWDVMFNNEKNSQWKTYSFSKFATALLASNLNKLDGVKATAVHPGAVDTSLLNGIGTKLRKHLSFLGKMMIGTEEAAKHVVQCVEQNVHPSLYSNEGKLEKLNSAPGREQFDGLAETYR
uniref:Uncharacterized protein n=1 Tax=Ditylenchus dipsaci TaxID=166011 RepID=A0A915CT11_9BILA